MRTLSLFFLSSLLLVSAGAAAAPPDDAGSTAGDAAATTQAEATHELTGDSLNTFFAGLIPYALERGDIAGGAISVVKDGRIIFAKGYGSADLAKHKPVVADQTIFRIGSVSKLFTWTAVMQLVAAGKIDLDRDINAYLDFKIPPKFGKPITMRDLMTMTPGFEDVARDLIVPKTQPLRHYLVRNLPERIFPPGKIVSYSNYGATLAGYIVQRLSGEPFADYVREHILKPLQMSDSTFAQPLPKALQPAMSKGYAAASQHEAKPFELIEAAPAGSMSSTATDMAHFMIAELDAARYDDGARILPPRELKLMHTQHYAPAPGMNGYAFGFYQEDRNGLGIIGHGGDTQFFHSDLHLIPGKNVGIFLTFNSTGQNGAVEKVRTALFRKFLDHYFPYSPPKEKTVAHPQKDAARVAGWYLGTRREESALRLLFVLTQGQVNALPNGEITVSMLSKFSLSGAPKRWREVGPLYYREVGGQAHLKFVTDDDGHILYWTSDDFPSIELFQRTHGMEQLGLFRTATSGFIVVLILSLLIWFGAWLVRRRYRASLGMTPPEYWLRTASRLGAVLLLAVVAIWIWIIAVFASGGFDVGGLLLAAYVLGCLGLVGALAIIVAGVRRITRGPGGIVVRIGETLLVLSAIYGIWAILAFGLVSFHMNY